MLDSEYCRVMARWESGWSVDCKMPIETDENGQKIVIPSAQNNDETPSYEVRISRLERPVNAHKD